MNKLIRFEPQREMVSLRDAMDRLFDDAFMRPSSLLGSNWQAPAVDMYQTDNDIVIKAALPGLKADQVQISVTGEVLTFKGEVKQDEET
jgi:HSP20 family protein